MAERQRSESMCVTSDWKTVVDVDVAITSAVVLLLWAQLLSKSLDQIKDETWFTECGDALVKHIPLYAMIPDEKVST